MSDHISPSKFPSRRSGEDRGMTLPEVLIVAAVMGLIASVLSMSIVVTLRQSDNTQGRVNVARAEQSISMWMPADLASADVVDTSPAATPCGATTCAGVDLTKGSNVLMLSWTSVGLGGATIETNISYHFTLRDGEYILLRIECVDGTCDSRTVLNDLPGPPGGAPFVSGVAHGADCSRPVDPVPCTRPDWVIIVSEPLAPDAIDESDLADDSDDERKDANRVIVTINGGGDVAGAGGGINQISITAGGTVRSEIAATSVQGAPSFVEARSRCGGPIALVIDESNSLRNEETNLENGVTDFVEALAGTPVQIMPVRFGTYSGVLGTSDWHRYYDMTSQSDVDDLLDSIDDIREGWASNDSRGGTNWEEALFRTFYDADGSTADTIPETVVFFTDGVPTYDRLVKRTSPGILPAEPADPGDQWADSTGSSYSQVAFNRANFIANKFRRSVRLIGVGVGSGITSSSQWIVDPGAGYTWQWERAYRRYQTSAAGYQSNLDVEEGYDTESRADFEYWYYGWRDASPTDYYANNVDSGSWDGWRINGTRSWYNVSQGEYDTYASLRPNDWKYDDWTNTTADEYWANNTTPDHTDGWRINGTRSWYDVGQTLYDANNVNGGESDGWRTSGVTQWVSKSEYEANNTTPDGSDGWIDTGSEEWVSSSQGTDWMIWTGSRPGDSNQYRSTKVYNNPPYDGFDSPISATTSNSVILARLIAGNDNGTPAIPTSDGLSYSNIEVADLYLEPDWNNFSRAMEAVALGECGGTLTLQTKINGSSPAPDPFRYQNSAVTDAAGDPIDLEPTVVTTNQQFTTGTFDFAIPSGTYVTVDILPQNFSELTAYNPGSWSCKAGVSNRSVTPIDIADSGGWKGMRVQVAANEAVSCTLSVTQ